MATTDQASNLVPLPAQAPVWDALWAEFDRHMAAKRRSPNTRESYSESARFFRDWLLANGRPTAPHEIEKRDVEDWLIALEAKGNRPRTLRNRHSALRAFFAWLVREEEIERSPMPEPPSVPEDDRPVLTDEEVKAILRATARAKDFESKRDEAMIRLLIDSRLRRTEVATLQLDQLDRDEHEARVLVKGGKTRPAWWGATTAVALDRYIRARAKHKDAGLPDLWLSARGGVLTGVGVHKMIHRRIREAGITRDLGPIGPHLFCHYGAHTMKAGGASDEDVMAWGGWRDHRVMRQYARSTALARAKAYHAKNAPGDRL